MNDKKLYVLRGIPGSGKSTIAKQYVPSADIFSTDDYWGVEYKFDIAKIGIAHHWNQSRVEMAMKLDRTPIAVDNTNTTWKEIEPYIHFANKYGYEVVFLEPNSPWWQIFKNGNKAAAIKAFVEKNIHNVPLHAIERMVGRWQKTEEIQKKYLEVKESYDKSRI